MNFLVQAVADAVVAGAKFWASKTANTWDDAAVAIMAAHEAEAVALIEALLAKFGATPGMKAGPPASKDEIKKALTKAVQAAK